jgi:hypothetical protein
MNWILPGDIISHFWIGQLTTLDTNPHSLGFNMERSGTG